MMNKNNDYTPSTTNDIEDIEHFLQDWETLTCTRQYIIGLQNPYKDNRDDHIAELKKEPQLIHIRYYAY